MKLDNNQHAFFALLRAGLWEKDVRLSPYGMIDYEAIYKLSEEQSVVGLIAAGLGYVDDLRPAKKDVVRFISHTVYCEQRNKEMNRFICMLTDKLRSKGIVSVLVKGQGVAQCYEKPLWRSCGDVDLLFDSVNYQKAKSCLLPLAIDMDEEDASRLHLCLTLDQWAVELHGTLRSGFLTRMDTVLDEVQQDVFKLGRIRTWKNGNVDVTLPSAGEDVVFVFSHILQHYFGGGIGLRQISDWCRLLWKYQNEIDRTVLKDHIQKMRMMPEWQAFAALAVNWLEMPPGAMPFYTEGHKWKKKANRIMLLVLESGNFGKGRDRSYKERYSPFFAYVISFWVHTRYHLIQFSVFPQAAFKGWMSTITKGIRAALNNNKN